MGENGSRGAHRGAKDPVFTVVEILLAAAATRPIAIADFPYAAAPEVVSAVPVVIVTVCSL